MHDSVVVKFVNQLRPTLFGLIEFLGLGEVDLDMPHKIEILVQAVEVLWTPQDENDTLSERELLRDYPLLRSL